MINIPKTGVRLVDTMLSITRNNRQKEYGHALINFIRMAEYAQAHWRGRLAPGEFWTPLDVIHVNDGWKSARELEVHKEDNLVDKMGYIDCYERIDDLMRELGYIDGAEAFRTMSEQEMRDLRYRLEREKRDVK